MTVHKAERMAYAGERTLRWREVMTPEGIPISIGVARIGDRMAALLIDGVLIFVLGLVVMLSLSLMGAQIKSLGEDFAIALAILVFTLLRLFYFTFMELWRNGATYGKRAMKLRVVEATGKQLSSEAVLTRNFMREIELWIPLQLMMTASTHFPMAPGWARAAALLWVFVLILVPVFNADRRRIGDFVAGTMVAILPDGRLTSDLLARPAARRGDGGESAEYSFTLAQLGIYGVYELEVLEDLLRSTAKDRHKTFELVSRKILRKLKAEKLFQVSDPEQFLRQFYRAQRAHLEQKLLLGQRKASKNSAPGE